jgi:hypothetical protein
MNWQTMEAFIWHGMASGIGAVLLALLARMQFDVSGCDREERQLLRHLPTSSFLLRSLTSSGPVELE